MTGMDGQRSVRSFDTHFSVFRVRDPLTYSVKEIFYTLQGEGGACRARVGVLSLFRV